MHQLSMDVLQAHELRLALERAGFTDTLIKQLCDTNCDVLHQSRDVLRRDAEVTYVRRIINLDDDVVLDGKSKASVIKHVKLGKQKWDKINLVAMCPQDLQYDRDRLNRRTGYYGTRYELQLNPRTLAPRYLRGQKLPNIHMRDYLLANPHLIPCWPAAGRLLFWGTIMQNKEGFMWVPGIDWTVSTQDEPGHFYAADRSVQDPSSSMKEEYEEAAAVFA